MARQILDYDPLTGITTYFDYEHGAGSDRMHITSSQDTAAIVNQTKAMANDTDYSRRGIKDDLWHYARLPLTVLMEIEQKYGVQCISGDVKDWKSFFAIINRDYPDLKATAGTHAG